MLNAFRHQRRSHRRVGSHERDPCAVLNAFRHQRRSHRGTGCWRYWPAYRAQRLSASTKVSRQGMQVMKSITVRNPAFKDPGDIMDLASDRRDFRGSPWRASQQNSSKNSVCSLSFEAPPAIHGSNLARPSRKHRWDKGFLLQRHDGGSTTSVCMIVRLQDPV